MKLTIELDQEVDGRWIAEVPELNILLYGDSKLDAVDKAQASARKIVRDRIARGELPPDFAIAAFAIHDECPVAPLTPGK
jgi:predicted nucleic acid-binding protein